jgi:hypothetical protein
MNSYFWMHAWTPTVSACVQSAIAQTVSHRLATQGPGVRSHVTLYGNRGEQSDTGTGVLIPLPFTQPQFSFNQLHHIHWPTNVRRFILSILRASLNNLVTAVLTAVTMNIAVLWGARSSVVAKNYATSRKVVGSKPDDVNEFLQFT